MKLTRLLMSLALMALLIAVVGCERKVVNQAANPEPNEVACFSCHGETALNGAILQAEGEWKNSVHASGNNVDYTNRPGSDCQRCHDQQGFIDFITGGRLDTLYSTVSAIHCFTCHAPHEKGNMDLRTTAPFTMLDGSVFNHGEANLCANCHHARMAASSIASPTDSISTRWGPHHSMQGDIINGTNGY